MASFTYFGYGSNMLTCKLKDRCPSAVPIGICKIKKHSLKFHKVSHAKSKNGIRDISGKGDMVPSESETDEVYGVLFSIDESHKSRLDKAEGYPKYGYDKKTIDVITIKGEKYRPVMYFANDIDPKKKPYHWYKEQVVQGAREHGLPEDYIKKIKDVESIPDQDQEREKEQSKHLV